MATWIANGTPGTTSATLPAGTANGDYVFVAAYGTGAALATLPADWTVCVSRAVSPSILGCFREKDASWSAMPTFTGAARCVSTTIRAASGMDARPGANANQGATSTSITWAAMTLNVTNGSSVVLRLANGIRPDVVIPTPTGHTLIDANGTRPAYGTYRLNTTTSAPTVSSAVSRSDVWSTAQVEIKDVIPPNAGTATVSNTWDASASGVAPLAPAVTQAGYRFFDQGTESGSTPLGAENTPITGVLTTGDGIGSLRVLLQSTNARAIPATDDWQLRWEKNNSGTWSNVAAPSSSTALQDSYETGTNESGAGPGDLVCQSFLGDGRSLVRASFQLRRSGTTDGTMTARLYAHTGTFGNGGTGTGSPLATSTTTTATSSVGSTSAWFDFDFAGYTLQSGVPYVIAFSTTNTFLGALVASTATSGGTHVGNQSMFITSAWSALAGRDTNFRVYTNGPRGGEVSPYNDPALTDGQATTNRMTGGVVMDSYAETNVDSYLVVGYTNIYVGQSFLGNGQPITRVGFWMSRQNSPVQTYVARIHNHSGTFGTSSTASGPGAVNSTARPASSFSDTPRWEYFDFPTPKVTVNGTPYVAVVAASSSYESNNTIGMNLGVDASSPSHAGNASYSQGSATAIPGSDLAFQVIYGAFSAGKASVTGLVTDLGFPGNNFTELLYPVQISKAAFVDGDVIKFRVLRNGSPATVTIGQTPTINVSNLSGPPPNTGSATVSHSWTGSAVGAKPLPASISTLIDSFDTSLDTVKWAGSATSPIVVWEAGRIKIESNTDYTGDLRTPAIYDLAGSSIFAKVTPPTAGEFFMRVRINPGFSVNFYWWNGHLDAEYADGGPLITLLSRTYSPTNDAWLRIRESGGTTYWDTSPDSNTWNNFASVTTPSWVASHSECFLFFESGSDPTQYAYVDNVNVPGVTGPPPNQGSATATWSETVTAAGVKPVVGVKQGSATATWSEAISAQGKKSPIATSTASWTETIIATGKRTPRATATANFVETVSGSGKKSPVSTAIANYLETIVAAGKKFQKAIATANFLETISVTTKRSPIATSTANHSWTTIAQGVKPVVGVKQGTAIASWSEALTAAGKRSPKATATTQFTETVTANGTKPQRGTATASWLETIAAAGKRDPKATATANYTENPGAAGKRTPKATSTANHSWTSIAQGFKPVVGQKQGSAIASWSETITATGKRTPKATSTTLYTENVTAAGKKIQKSTVTTTWTNAITAAGKKIQKATSVTTYSYDVGAVGKKTPKGSTTAVNHSWTLIAQGVKPVVGSKQGSALVFTAWTGSAVGKKSPKATASAVWTETTTAFGKKLQNGSGIVLWTEKVSVFGAKPLRGSTIVTWSESVIVSGKRIPKAIGFVFHNWVGDAEGKYNPLGISTLEILWQLSAIGVDERGIVILNDAEAIHLGSKQVKAVYLGSEKVWEML